MQIKQAAIPSEGRFPPNATLLVLFIHPARKNVVLFTPLAGTVDARSKQPNGLTLVVCLLMDLYFAGQAEF